MRLFRPIQLFFVIGLTICLSIPVHAKKEKMVQAWHIKQKHKLFGRQIEIFIAPNQYRWTCKDSQITVIMKAPKWNVVVFNSRTSTIYRCRAEEFKSPVADTGKLFDGINWSQLPLKKVGQVNLSGVQLEHYRSGATHPNLKRTDYWVSKNLPINKSVILMMSRLYNAPVKSGIPIKHLYLRPEANTPTAGINTFSITKEPIPFSTFKIPDNLRLVKTENEIFADKRHEKSLEWMIR